MVLADRKLKLREIVDTFKISEGSVFTILHEHLNMRKHYPKWVPRLHKSIATIALCIAFPSTVFSVSGSKQLVPVCRPKKNAPWKEI